MQKIILTIVSLNVIVVVPLLVYGALAVQTLVWESRVMRSKIDTIMLNTRKVKHKGMSFDRNVCDDGETEDDDEPEPNGTHNQR